MVATAKVKRCSRCKRKRHVKNFTPDSRYKSGLRSQCRDCVRLAWGEWSLRNPGAKNAMTKASMARVKEDVLAAYGKKCACCGELELMFLTVDHVNNNGVTHRRENTSYIYFCIRREGYPSAYQILCYNCNLGRARNGGVCPHLVERYAQ